MSAEIAKLDTGLSPIQIAGLHNLLAEVLKNNGANKHRQALQRCIDGYSIHEAKSFSGTFSNEFEDWMKAVFKNPVDLNNMGEGNFDYTVSLIGGYLVFEENQKSKEDMTHGIGESIKAIAGDTLERNNFFSLEHLAVGEINNLSNILECLGIDEESFRSLLVSEIPKVTNSVWLEALQSICVSEIRNGIGQLTFNGIISFHIYIENISQTGKLRFWHVPDLLQFEHNSQGKRLVERLGIDNSAIDQARLTAMILKETGIHFSGSFHTLSISETDEGILCNIQTDAPLPRYIIIKVKDGKIDVKNS